MRGGIVIRRALIALVLATALLLGFAGLALGEYNPVDLGNGAVRSLGDLDGDGRMDAIFFDADEQGAVVVTTHQGSDGTFAPPTRVGPTHSPFGFLAAADVADGAAGALDVVRAPGPMNNEVIVYRNAGGGAFSDPLPVTIPGVDPDPNFETHGLVSLPMTGDVTGDGRSDAVFMLRESTGGETSSRRVVLVTRGPRGDPLVRVSAAIGGAESLSGARLFDVDHDGTLDVTAVDDSGLVYSTARAGKFSVWRPAVPFSVEPPLALSAFAPGDFDSDGKVDVVLAETAAGTGRFLLYLSTPVDEFGQTPRLVRLPSPAGVPCRVGVGNLDGDAHLDLLLRSCRDETETPPAALTLLGDGAGGFAPQTTIPLTLISGNESADIADVDGDGLGDLILIGGGDSNTVVYMSRRLFVEPPCTTCTGQTRGSSDTRKPIVRLLKAPGRWSPSSKYRYQATCDEACTVTVNATVALWPTRRGGRALSPILVKTLHIPLAANEAKTAKIGLHGGSLKRVRKILAHGGRAKLVLAVSATDASGNVGTTKKTITLRTG